MAHIIQSPGIFDYQNRDPLRFSIGDEHEHARDASNGIDKKESNIKMLFVTRFFFIIGNIQKPIPYFLFHIFKIHQI